MDNKKDNRYYINKIITDLVFITYHTENLTIEELEENEILVDSMMFRPIQISENSDRGFQGKSQSYPMESSKGIAKQNSSRIRKC